MTTEHLNNLADALENIAHMEYPSDHHDRKNLAEAARILRSAAAVDVKALITIVQDFGSARWAEGFDEKNKPYGESALHKKVAVKKLAALESALRLALAAREWQPIETAPQDGSTIWVLDELYGKPWQYGCIWNGIEWYHGFGDAWPSAKPTGWMPLPAAAPKGTT